jgi:hypothetical protein
MGLAGDKLIRRFSADHDWSQAKRFRWYFTVAFARLNDRLRPRIRYALRRAPLILLLVIIVSTVPVVIWLGPFWFNNDIIVGSKMRKTGLLSSMSNALSSFKRFWLWPAQVR